MSDFKAKVHQIRFPLGLRCRRRSLAVFKEPTSKGKVEEWEWRRMEGERRGGAHSHKYSLFG